MPFPGFDPALTLTDLENISFWIAAGAPISSCTCP